MLTRATLSDPESPWVLRRSWTEGHAGVVRSVLWDEPVSYIIPLTPSDAYWLSLE